MPASPPPDPALPALALLLFAAFLEELEALPARLTANRGTRRRIEAEIAALLVRVGDRLDDEARTFLRNHDGPDT